MGVAHEITIGNNTLSEDELHEQLIDSLSEHDGIDWSHLHVKVRGEEIYLTGQVGTEEEKQIAELVALDAIDVSEIHNYLKVDPWSSKRYEPSQVYVEEGEEWEERSETPAHGEPEGQDLQCVMEEGIPWEPPEMPPAGMGY